MSGDEDVDLAGILAHALSQAGVGEDLIEGVADVFEIVVEFVAVALEVVLQALEQVAREEALVSLQRQPKTSGLDS